MNLYKDFAIEIKKILKAENIKIDEPMKKHTSFKVGGPADIFITPERYEDIGNVIKLCKENNVPYYIIGNGSNLLVKDGGIRGVVLKLCKLNSVRVEDDKVIAQSGVSLCRVSSEAAKHSLTGFEFASGIPGSVGGALTMNAGAYNGEVSQVIESALIIDNNGIVRKISNGELELGYRMSSIVKYGYTVLEATFKLEKGNYSDIKGRIEDLSKRRMEKQPLEYPSAGSTFKRPQGYFAAKLIQDTGLKGISVGGAEVSKKHSGFIINKGNATAKDILDLIKIVQEQVKQQHGVELHTEVKIIGEDK